MFGETRELKQKGFRMKTRSVRSISAAVTMAGFLAVETIAAEPNKKSLQSQPLEPSVVASAEQLSKAFAMVAEHVRPAVVSVYSEKMVKLNQPEFPIPFGEDFFQQFFGGDLPNRRQRRPGQPREHEFQSPQKMPLRGMGSGMILDKEGRILTNFHVVDDVDEIKIQLADKSSYEAEIVSTDPPTDIAVIRIKGRVPENLPIVELGDSDALEVGHLVMAVGAPFGFVQTVTTGVLSAAGRSGIGINDYENFLQTDAAINPGNSGGPLVNMRGQVIGINSVIATHGPGQFAGVGFAIPINMVKTILPTLAKGGTVTRGMLGVVIQEVTSDLARQFKVNGPKGALISQVNSDSPAEKAGLKPGDVIIGYNGKDVEDTTHLRNMVAASAPGAAVKLDVMRGGQKERMAVTIGKLSPETTSLAGAPPRGETGKSGRLGLNLQTLTPDLAREFGYKNQKGAVITGVEPGTPASEAGLQEGDLIVEVNRQKITNAEEAQKALSQAKDENSALLLVKRENGSLFVVLPPK
jgi:serine protease Do